MQLCVDQTGSQCENSIIAIKLASQELSKIVWKKCRKWWDYAMTLCASIFSWKARKIEKIVKMCIFIKRKKLYFFASYDVTLIDLCVFDDRREKI